MNNRIDLKIINKEYIKGDKKLELFNNFGIEAEITDLGIITGGIASNLHDNSIKTTNYYINNKDNIGNIWVIGHTGFLAGCCDKFDFNNSIRLMIKSNILIKQLYITERIQEIEYGSYPQDTVDNEKEQKLNSLLKDNKLIKTGKEYIFNSLNLENSEKEIFQEYKCSEYFFNNEKFILIKSNSCYKEFTLSNNKKYKNGDLIWIQVKSIKWIVDYKNKIFVSKKALLSGIKFYKKDQSVYGENTEFRETNLYNYINKIMKKNIGDYYSKIEKDIDDLKKIKEKLIINKEKQLIK